MSIIIFTVSIFIVVYLLIGGVYVTVIYRRETVTHRRYSEDKISRNELILALTSAAISWPVVMYTRIMDERDRRHDIEHRHVLRQENS